MPKIKVKPKEKIKKLDKEIVQVQKLKNNLITTKEKINEITINEENNSPEEYASIKIQNDISYISRKSGEKFNEVGKKSVKETKENFAIGKKKIENLKNKVKEKQEKDSKNIIEKNSKTIKNKNIQTIKNGKNTNLIAKKSIKTPEQFEKNTEKMTKESLKLIPKVEKVIQKAVKATAKSVEIAVKTTIETAKSIIAIAKTAISAIIAGGWIAVIVILITALIGGFIAAIFNTNGDTNYDSSQIPSNEIILVAKSQIGNEGGDKFWKWYGFEEHVYWCACFVSWCANECGYIDRGIIPKFALCTDGINWFKEKNQWHNREENYYPIIGDIIFFDWYDENGNQDGISDHVGIVEKIDIMNRTIYTIEGNTNNKCAERTYPFDDAQVIGYGTPKYE